MSSPATDSSLPLPSRNPDPKFLKATDAAAETFIPIHERVRRRAEWLEADFANTATKIHRFPASLRRLGGPDNRYIVPSMVALGPYHHGSEHLQEMENVKHVAAHNVCKRLGQPVGKVYGKIFSIVGEARRCYDDKVARFSDADFAAMMFLDGCFLLHYISNSTFSILLTNKMMLSAGNCILRDIFLLENQLPWIVLEAIMAFSTNSNFPNNIVHRYAADKVMSFDSSGGSQKKPPTGETHDRHIVPSHLLGLLRHYQVGSMPVDETILRKGDPFSLGSSAIELAEIGIKLTPSNKPWFADICINNKGRPFFGELSLTPLYLDDVHASWLVNMVALEACCSTSKPYDGFAVSSYLSTLAMLIDKEEDVHELRAKHLLRSTFSNKELLNFFKGLSRHLRLGHRYLVVCRNILDYKRERPVRIAVHKFLYNQFKAIVTLLSIAGVLVGIFKTIMGLKQHQQ